MANKFPTNQSFQRLTNFPLDETTVFDTLAQAQDYAKNNPTAYKGQVVHVKDARTDTEINNDVNIYEETCYIDLLKNIVPICSFTYEAMGIFFDIIYEVLNGPTEETRNKLDTLKGIMYDNYAHDFNDEPPTGDYHTQPWHPGNYNARQLCYRYDPNIGPPTNVAWTANGTAYQRTEEKITVMHNGIEEHYMVITIPSRPERVHFIDAEGILEIIHMWDTSRLTTLEDMFRDCKNLTRIRDINKWDVSNCESLTAMFTGCESLTSLDLSGWDTSNVTTINSMFANCYGLTSINLSGWDTSNVTNMKGMFVSCESLKTINLSHFITSNVINIAEMFVYCKSLTSVNLSGFDLSKITNRNNADNLFYRCENLKYINFSNLTFEEDIYFRSAFTYCDSLLLENINMTGCSEYVIQTITDRYNTQT